MADLQRQPILETAYTVATGESITQWTLVKRNSSNEDQIDAVDAATDTVLGIAQEDGSAGDTVRVMLLGISPLKAADGSVSDGDLLIPDASARGDSASGDEDNVFGRAIGSSTAANEYIPVLLGMPGMTKGTVTSYVYCASAKAATAFPADITASVADDTLFVAEGAGKIEDVILYVDNTGADGTDDLAIDADVDIGGTSCLTTKPAITDSASDQSNSKAGGTGVTTGVVDSSANTLAAGDRVSVDLNLTRTTPEDEMAGVIVCVKVRYTA